MRCVPPPGGIVPDPPLQTVKAAPADGARMGLCAANIAEDLAAVWAQTSDLHYPYCLAARPFLETMNSAYHETAAAARRFAVNPAFMSHDDMTDKGLTAAECVESASLHGALLASVQPEKSVRRGMISMAHFWERAIWN